MRVWLFLAALNGFLASGAGAIGTHMLQGQISANNLAIFDTAARYHMWHALALFAVAWLASRTPTVPHVITIAGAAFFLGIVLILRVALLHGRHGQHGARACHAGRRRLVSGGLGGSGARLRYGPGPDTAVLI